MVDDDIWTERKGPEPGPSPRPPRPRRPTADGRTGRETTEFGTLHGRVRIGDRPDRASDGGRRGSGTRRRSVLLLVIGLLMGAILGAGGVLLLDSGPEGDEAGPVEAAEQANDPIAPPSTTTVAPTSSEPATTESIPATTLPAAPQGSVADDLERARALSAAIVDPSDCGLPSTVPESLPNAGREYRGGVHMGIDYICAVRGRTAVAALDGRVVMANASYEDPAPEEREEILDVARGLGRTPPWILSMLYGRVVVLDHGIVEGVGHVATIYAHLESIDPEIRPGRLVAAGDRLGEIGNTGTESAAAGTEPGNALHLHWEIHIDDHFLAEGGTAEETRTIYEALFDR